MKRLLLALILSSSLMTAPAHAQDLNQAIARDMPDLIALYRDLHQHPELSMQETRSAGLLAAEARRLGFEVTTGVGGTGVVALLRNGEGPVLLLRADMHRLFDQGYVTITPDRQFHVSERLRRDYENGRTYYPFHGKTIASPPSGPEPAHDFLAWHNEHVYRP